MILFNLLCLNKVFLTEFLKEAASVTEFIQPVCLPPDGQHFTAGRKCFIAGWGRDTDGDIHTCARARTHTHTYTQAHTHILGEMNIQLQTSHYTYLCFISCLFSAFLAIRVPPRCPPAGGASSGASGAVPGLAARVHHHLQHAVCRIP